tara:strand:- start:150 stop:1097 length:948 start_codon:yes stop_codon:yes gene_type:complete
MESFKNKMLSEMPYPKDEADFSNKRMAELRQKYGISFDSKTGKAKVKETPALKAGFRSVIGALVKRAVQDKDFEPPTFKSESVERLDEIVGALARVAGGLVGRSAAKSKLGAAAVKAGRPGVIGPRTSLAGIGRQNLARTMTGRSAVTAAAPKAAAAAAPKAAAAAAPKAAATLSPMGKLVSKRMMQIGKTRGLPATRAARKQMAINLKKGFESKINRGLMTQTGQTTSLGFARKFGQSKIKGIANPNLRGLASRALEGGVDAAKSLSGVSVKSAAGSLAKTAMRNPLTTMAVGSMVANRLKDRVGYQQPATGSY